MLTKKRKLDFKISAKYQQRVAYITTQRCGYGNSEVKIGCSEGSIRAKKTQARECLVPTEKGCS